MVVTLLSLDLDDASQRVLALCTSTNSKRFYDTE